MRKEDGEAKAKSLEANFVEVSAKSGDSIAALFRMIAGTLPGSEVSQIMPMSGRVSTVQGQTMSQSAGNNPTSSIDFLSKSQLLNLRLEIQLNPTTVQKRR